MSGLALAGPLHALGVRSAYGEAPARVAGYGPLTPKGPELALPPGFRYQVISRQGDLMRDGRPTPGAFDGMGAFRGPHGSTILIRNHENRERPGEVPVVSPYPYDAEVRGGATKLVVRRHGSRNDGDNEDPRRPTYTIEDSFSILGGTSTNCAGGVLPHKRWLTCEEVVKGPTSGPAPPRGGGPTPVKHGYVFEIDATADAPLPAVPLVGLGRFAHEATVYRAGILFQTEDRNNRNEGGSCFYRYVPNGRRDQSQRFADTDGVLQALKIKDEFRADMDRGREIGRPYAVEWVTVDEPDHDDDTDMDTARIPGRTPVRFQAQDKGAAVFDRQEGMWVAGGHGKVYFDCTEGGVENLGQVWEYDPTRESLTLIYESVSPLYLKHPDNIVIVPHTGDMFLCEDSSMTPQYIRGLTFDGDIYDFAQALVNGTEFAGACFDPDAETLYVNQYGLRSETELPGGPAGQTGITYAIHGPFRKRDRRRRALGLASGAPGTTTIAT